MLVFATVSVLLVIFLWPLSGVLLGVFHEYFALFRRVPRYMHQACVCNGHPISWMACITCLALADVTLIGVGWQGSFSSLIFPAMAVTVGICPIGIL